MTGSPVSKIGNGRFWKATAFGIGLFWVLATGALGSMVRVQAQSVVLSGAVADSDGRPLPGVNVVAIKLQKGAATDRDGRFRITGLPTGMLDLRISAVGYRTEDRTVELQAGADNFIRVTLQEISLRSGEILVTASRHEQVSSGIPASFNVIPARDLDIRGVSSLDQALRYVPGVQVMENQVNVRGSSGYSYNVGSRVLLLLDGVPLLTPDSDGVPFETLPFDHIKQIEVVKGPGSALWGSGALGGVIHVVTEDFPDKPKTMVRAQTGLHDPVSNEAWLERWPEGRDPRPFWRGSISHARKVGGRFGFWIAADYVSDDGYANMKTVRYGQLYGKVGWRPTNATNVSVLIAGLARRRENFFFWNGLDDALNPGVPTVGGVDRPAVTDVHTDQLIVAPSLTQIVGTDLLISAKLRAYGTRIEGVNDDETRSGNVTYGFRYGGDGQVTWTPTSVRSLIVGASGDMNTTESPFFLTSEGDPIGNQPEYAVFSQFEDALFPRLRVVAGVRYSAYAVTTVKTVDKITPKVALSYLAGEGFTLRASFGQGFRVPSLAERFIDDQDFVPLYPNLELEPETSTSYEVGLRWDASFHSGGSFRLDVAGFWNEYDGLIEPKLTRISAPGEPLEVGFKFLNLGESRIFGVDAGLDIGLPNGRGSAFVAYTYMNSKDFDQDRPLPFRPDHLVVAGLRAQLTNGLATGLDFQASSVPRELNSDFSLFVPDASEWIASRAFDYWISVSYSIARISLHARNIFDRYYTERPAFLAAPRRYFVELKLVF